MTRHPLAFALLVALTSSPVLAQSETADKAGARTLDTVVVTGTRVADRTVAESASPIDIITPETLEATGTTELATALARALPSLNFPRPALVDGTDAVRPAQLRGLSPDQVLVLVNGKRRHSTALVNLNGSQGRGSSPVDLNAIPIAAIARVEVLRDGASAQYGSDAIAGVINVVLKGSGEGGGIAARYGQFSAGDGQQYQLSGDVGLKLGDRGALHLAAQAGHQDMTDRARPYLGTVTPTSAPAGRVVQRFGDPDVDQGAVSFNGEFKLAEGLSFYSFGTASKRDVISTGFFRPAGDARNVPSIYPDGYLPQILNTAEDRAFVAGIKGYTAGGLNIDFSYNYGNSELDFNVANSLNRSIGASSPTRFRAGSLAVDQHVLNLDFSKPLEIGLAYPLALAFGAEWRGESFRQRAGEPASYINGGVLYPNNSPTPSGSQVFPGFQPGDAGAYDRNSLSYYIDLEADLSDKFSLALAGRHENYSDFGDTTSGKLSARYAFTDRVALRGTVSSGFRAPSLQQQFYQSTSNSFIGGIPFDLRTFRVNDPAAIALGAESLRAEESLNYGLGLVLQPIDNLYVTVDAYRIRIDNRIVLSENLNSTLVRNYLNSNGYPNISGGRYFSNAIDTTTTGIDVVGSYRWALDNGSVDLTAGYNHNKTVIDTIAPNPASLAAIDPAAVRIGRTEIGRITTGAPRDKFFVGGLWTAGNWGINANATRYGEFTVFNNNPVQDQTFGAKWTLDLAATYKLDRWEFTLGGDNVLNAYPDTVIYANSSAGQLPYSSSSPFGFNGAFMYAKVGYKW